jgi:glycosyl transferase family 25
MQQLQNLPVNKNELQKAYNTLNSFFDHIYVISLSRATERHVHFKNELEGLEYSVMWGKDSKELNEQQLTRSNIYNKELDIKNNRYNISMGLGAIACSWSHLLVYEDMLKNGYDKVLILEDDVVFNQDPISFIPEILNALPKDWELLYLGFTKNEPSQKYTSLKRSYYHFLRFFKWIELTHKEISNRFPKRVSKHVYKAGYHDCTHSYGITASCAEKFIKLQTPISFPADHLLAHVATNDIAKSYIVIPKIISQLRHATEQFVHSYVGE